MENKKCKLCGIYKTLEEYSKNKLTKDGRIGKCRECESKLKHEHYLENRDSSLQRVKKWTIENPERAASNKRKHYENNKELIKERSRKYYQANKHQKVEYQRKYSKENRDKINFSNRKRRATRMKSDLNYKISEDLRHRVGSAIRGGAKSGSAVGDLGCSIDEFKKYIEKLFEPGMVWENWGHKTWHLDHIIPLAVFDLADRDQFLKATHYTNYKPMWAKANMIKGAKISAEYNNDLDIGSLPKSFGVKFNTYLQDTLTKEHLVELIVYKRMKVPQICKELNVTEGSVVRYMKMFNLSSRWHHYYSYGKLKELCDLGLSTRQIGELLGISRGAVKGLIKQKGLKTNLKSIADIKDITSLNIDLTGILSIP